MNKTSSKTLFLCFLLTLFSILLFIVTIETATAQPPPTWWNKKWLSCTPVNVTETAGLARVSEPTDIHITFEPGTCSDPSKEVRVVYLDGSELTEVTSQVYNVTKEGEYARSCNVVFLADCPAHGSVTHYIYYNNPYADTPIYDGLRLFSTKDYHNVTVFKDGVEKNYFFLFWGHCLDLYSDGVRVAWPGGPAGWEFCQIYLASSWADAAGNVWFSTGDKLRVLSSGPLFAEFSITQPFSTPWPIGIYNYNITTTYLVKVYYQPDLNPLVHYSVSYTFKNSDSMANILYLNFKLADNASSGDTKEDWTHAVYKGFTWKNTAGLVQTAPTETTVTDHLWSSASPVGWWSYNGSRPDSTNKPAANMGLIPTHSGGTIAGADYIVNFTQRLPVEQDDHECTQYFTGTFNGVAGDTVETTGCIVVTTPVDENIAPTMEEKAKKLRNPLEYTVGSAFTMSVTVAVEPRWIWVPPLDINDTFTLNITVRKIVGLYAWQAGLNFDPDILEAVSGSIKEGPFLKSAGNTTFFAGTILNDTGVVTYSNATLTDSGVSKSGNGTLMSIDFRIKKFRDCTIELTGTLLLDEFGKEIDHGIESGFFMSIVDITPPTIMGIVPAMAGQEIAEGAEVGVNVTVTDNPTVHSLTGLTINASGVDKVFIKYSIDEGNTWDTTNMTKVEETDVYNGTIPAFGAWIRVMYKIVASDKNGNEAISPTYWYEVRPPPPRVGMWFGLGIAAGSIIVLVIAAVVFYARKP